MTDTTVRRRSATARPRSSGSDGEITGGSEPPIMAAYAEAGDARLDRPRLQPARLHEQGGIGLLVTLLVRTQRAGQKLLAVGLTEHYRQILALTRLDEAIAIHDDETAALAAASA